MLNDEAFYDEACLPSEHRFNRALKTKSKQNLFIGNRDSGNEFHNFTEEEETGPEEKKSLMQPMIDQCHGYLYLKRGKKWQLILAGSGTFKNKLQKYKNKHQQNTAKSL